MDASTIKTLLESQERAYKTAMDMVVKQMNDRIEKLESTVADLTSSLQFSQGEIDDLKSAIKQLEKDKQDAKIKMDRQEADINSSKSEIESLEDRCNYMEDYSRRNNIRITGIKEQNGNETWEQTAAKVLSVLDDKLQLPDLDLERAHRVGQRRDDKPRTIVARFSRYRDREAVMRNARKLKGTNIYMNDDLCAASQAIKNAQLPQLKQARAEGKVAFFRHTKLIIRDSPTRGSNVPHQNETPTVEPDDGTRAPATAAAAATETAEEGGGASGGDAAFPPLPQPQTAATHSQTQDNALRKSSRIQNKK